MVTKSHSKRRIEFVNLFILLQKINPETASLPFVYAVARNVRALNETAVAHDKYLAKYEDNSEWKAYQEALLAISGDDITSQQDLDIKYASVIEKRKADTKLLHEYLEETITLELIQLPLSEFPADYPKPDFISLTDHIDHER